MPIINDGWDQIKEQLPTDWTAAEYAILRQVFFSGAGLVLSTILDFGKPNVTDADVDKAMDEMDDEMRAFMKGMRRKLRKDRN